MRALLDHATRWAGVVFVATGLFGLLFGQIYGIVWIGCGAFLYRWAGDRLQGAKMARDGRLYVRASGDGRRMVLLAVPWCGTHDRPMLPPFESETRCAVGWDGGRGCREIPGVWREVER